MMDTDDYITQYLKHLTDKNTHRLITTYPTAHNIQKQLLQVLNFKQELDTHDKRLYKYLLPQTDKTVHHVLQTTKDTQNIYRPTSIKTNSLPNKLLTLPNS